ncbi:MAG: 4-hydroxyphenylpyruvate dioxygenase [Rhodobacteraceae bacterium]|nr:4-hydroxyphenylpyruvate dioxygenase [Paracoccaceae bacterium]
MSELSDNPIGLDGFEFIEFTADNPEEMARVFGALGFSKVATHRSKAVDLLRQGQINIILNYEGKPAPAAFFRDEHGAGVCGLAFRVKDARVAYDRLLQLGAEPADVPVGPMELRIPAIKGIGGALIYLVDRYDEDADIYDIDFKYLPNVDRHPAGLGLDVIDHLTHNVYKGRMAHWAGFYERLFGFREIRYFDIKGEYTGLQSKAMSAPDGKIRIPLNEEKAGGGGQIEEYLMKFNGEGVQHIAFSTPDIYAAVDKLRASGVPLMTAPPDTYYEMLEERLPNHGEPVEDLKKRGLLLDGSTDQGDPRLLLQIFSECLLGPVFFEFIQRKKDEGFGEGNFSALFKSMERDQVRRGVLKTESAP